MKRIVAVILALLTLTAHTGLILATHYCGGKAIKSAISLIPSDLSCGMSESHTQCEMSHTSSSLERKNCCENEYMRLFDDSGFLEVVQQAIAKENSFIPTLFVPSFGSYRLLSEYNFGFPFKQPPRLNFDAQVLFQSFLF